MLKVGITGGIGSGKTTVCRVFELLGIHVFYADDEAKKLLDNDPDLNQQLMEIFGKEILNEEGKADRKKLASIVFGDKEKLDKLNSIVHPFVGKRFEEWCAKKSSVHYVLKEAAVLFESGAYKKVDKVITITAPLELKISRVMARDKMTVAEMEKRMKNQLNDEEKVKRSDFVIVNDEQQMIIQQILGIHKLLIEHK